MENRLMVSNGSGKKKSTGFKCRGNAAKWPLKFCSCPFHFPNPWSSSDLLDAWGASFSPSPSAASISMSVTHFPSLSLSLPTLPLYPSNPHYSFEHTAWTYIEILKTISLFKCYDISMRHFRSVLLLPVQSDHIKRHRHRTEETKAKLTAVQAFNSSTDACDKRREEKRWEREREREGWHHCWKWHGTAFGTVQAYNFHDCVFAQMILFIKVSISDPSSLRSAPPQSSIDFVFIVNKKSNSSHVHNGRNCGESSLEKTVER